MNQQIGRRSMLKLGMVALAGTAIAKGRTSFESPLELDSVSSHSSSTLATLKESALSLPKVQVAPDRIIRMVAGLRPYRPSGFVVRAEHHAGKTIIHNYGHGGCGVTLSWGTGKLAVDLALKTPFRRAAVLGCGAVGLATARLLQDRGFQVTIYAKDLPPNTTSNIAGAMWEPVTLVDRDHRTPEFTTQLAEASRFANRYFQTLVGDRYGVKWIPIFFAGDQPLGESWISTVTPELYRRTQLTQTENPFPTPFASRWYTMLIEPSTYLPAVISDFCVRGGKIIVRDFKSLASILRLRERVILNCTGLGAKALFNDNEMEPVKGQLTVLLPQPEIDYGTVPTSGELYMFPRRDGIILGGSHQTGEWSLEPDPEVADRIFKGHLQFFAGMH